MSVDREIDVDLDAGRAVVVERREIDLGELFVDGELRLWEDGLGWSGYVCDDGAYYWVNTHHDADDWFRKVRVGEQAVRDAVRKHIADPEAGEAGKFRRRCSPP